jgi:methenyltetrahydromethanopterin cyclohydrolase
MDYTEALKQLSKLENKGDDSFPLYKLSTPQEGKIFAEASMGFLGDVNYQIEGETLFVQTTIKKPITATLGLQLAGMVIDGSILSGPLRMRLRTPSFIYDKLDIETVKEPDLICLEGNIGHSILTQKLREKGVEAATVLSIDQKSPAHAINIMARACEVAIFRLFNLFDISKFDISVAESSGSAVLTPTGEYSPHFNDAIRFASTVTLHGDFADVKDFSKAVTSGTKFADMSFSEIELKCGGIDKMDLDAFTISKLILKSEKGEEVFE